jgi:hypothetical protein
MASLWCLTPLSTIFQLFCGGSSLKDAIVKMWWFIFRKIKKADWYVEVSSLYVNVSYLDHISQRNFEIDRCNIIMTL